MKIINHSFLWVGCQSVSEVARAYFGKYSRTDKCVRRFRMQILETPGMYDEMVAAGYHPDCKFLTPAEMEIIIKYWKYPEHIARLAGLL